MAPRHPSVRVLALATVVAGLAPSFLPSPARAADPAPAAATVAPVADAQPYVGQITGTDVLVRCGPSEAFYATQKLNPGDHVTVVGVRGAGGDWLKIVPPDGSFCYVAQAYVERLAGSDTAGRVRKPDLNVRAGSLLNGSMKIVLTTLNTGDVVQIVGAPDDKYFKIAPPPGTYLYVQRSLVTPVAQAAPVSLPVAARANEREPIASDPVLPVAPAVAAVTPPPDLVPATPGPVAPAAAPSATVVAAAPATQPTDGAVLASSRVVAQATTEPSTRPSAVLAAATPTTRPAVVISPQQRFEMAEAEFARSSKLPLDRQPLEGLRWRYRTLTSNPSLSASDRQTAQMRIDALNLRIAARKEQADTNRALAAAAAEQKALEAERDELSQRMRSQQFTTYAALGTLRLSSLQQSGTTLYRLTDPNTGGTLVYLRSNDVKYAGLVNQFVGVKGTITTDAALSLRYVTPTDAEAVDVARVNNGVVAAISPPSLLGKGSTASNGN